jgi:prolyl-tRNA editing enzyme YbaK/EbsC (Cys-tRNA(Pro) deacylase)
MEDVLNNASVKRIITEISNLGISGQVTVLSESARSAAEAAAALNIQVGQIASSIVFKLPDGRPLLVITSGAHRVDTELVAKTIGVDKFHRADADFVKAASGISIGGVATMSNNELAAQGGRRTSHPNSRLMKSPPSIC